MEYTYAQAYGGEDYDSYSLMLDGIGSCAWYHEHQLTLIDESTPPPLKEQPSSYHPVGHPRRNILDELADELAIREEEYFRVLIFGPEK